MSWFSIQFSHPSSVPSNLVDNSRFQSASFIASETTTIHGFAGTFDCTLYDDITFSTVPHTFSEGTYIHAHYYPCFFFFFDVLSVIWIVVHIFCSLSLLHSFFNWHRYINFLSNPLNWMSCGNSLCVRNVLLVSYFHSPSSAYTGTGRRHYYCCGMEVRKRIRERECVCVCS